MKKSTIDTALTVLHVGGRGGLGEVERLFRLGKNLRLSIFEANIENDDTTWESYDALISAYASRYGIKLSILPYCLSDSIGKKTFHVNAMPDSSSLFEPDKDAINLQRMNCPSYRIIWGDISKPQKSISIDVTTINKLLADVRIPMPHVISVDAQGSEYQILDGASAAFEGDLVGVVSEVEFRQLYKDQKLFFDQHALLKEQGFHLIDLYNTEYWYPNLIIGKGALTVAEAFFLRDYKFFVRRDIDRPDRLLSNLSKLAIVSLCFERPSYTFEIMHYIVTNHADTWKTFVSNNPDSFNQELQNFYLKTKSIKAKADLVLTYEEYLKKHPRSGGITPAGVSVERIKKIFPPIIRKGISFCAMKLKSLMDIILYVMS